MTTDNASPYEIHDDRFRLLIVGNAELEELYSGCRWAEGPVWFADLNCLLFSDIPNERMLRWVPDGGVSVFRHPSNFTNGNTRDRQGRLVSCEHGGRRVTRTEVDGSITVLADSYGGKRLNSPNDVVVKSDGSVWFTDPTTAFFPITRATRRTPSRRRATSTGSIPQPARSRSPSTISCSQTVWLSRLMKPGSMSPTAPTAMMCPGRAISASSMWWTA